MKLLISFIAFLFPLNAQELIIEPDDGTAPILQAIDSAESSVDIAIYRLDHTDVMSSLKQARLRGVQVRIILNPPINTSNLQSEVDLTPAWEKLKKNEETAKHLRENGIIVYYASLENLVLFHTKLMIVDSKAAFVTTFNMNQSGFNCGRNFGYITRNPEQVENLTSYFNSQITKESLPLPLTTICFDPNYQRNFILLYILQTNKTLELYQACLIDREMALYLHLLASIGKKIRILFTPDLFGKDETSYIREKLHEVGVEFHYMTSPYVHAKLIIRDGESMLITSCNFWADGLDRSGELSLIIDDTEAIHKAKTVFDTDWENATSSWTATTRSSSLE
jgi:phosphatidylserine/phosphatidylglycerophosphate/cardiolipin synthase-like enzyme